MDPLASRRQNSCQDNLHMLITQHRKSFRFAKILSPGKNHQKKCTEYYHSKNDKC